jgi:serine/threonine protein kinase
MGVAHMHEKGFAHRDLKIDNLMYDQTTGVLKIIDFGFSLECTAATKVKLSCGTPLY